MTMAKTIRSVYGDRVRVVHEFLGKKAESRTKQEFKDDADIKTILRRYAEGGALPASTGTLRSPLFGDFTNVDAFRQQQEQVAQAKSDFELLPSGIRTMFKNDVVNLIEFLADPANEEEARSLGLLPSKQNDEPLGQGPQGTSESGVDRGGAPVQPPSGGSEEGEAPAL